MALATLLHFYSYYFMFGGCRVPWEVAPGQKSNLLWLQLSRFTFFLNYYISMTFCNFWPLNIFKPPKQCCRLSGSGNKWQQSTGDTEQWQCCCKQWRSVSVEIVCPFPVLAIQAGSSWIATVCYLLQHKCSRDTSAQGAVTVYRHYCQRQRFRILCLQLDKTPPIERFANEDTDSHQVYIHSCLTVLDM